ncbi:MAG: type IV secretory system conjugative DNA transfer family protein [Gemmatimonadaceae bacterium]|nr:type IV secretory system conjugative DNA transfer family protein [Gemmatimonadaceae bacterium]
MSVAAIAGAAGVVVGVIAILVVVPSALRAARRRAALDLMPRWPDDWPPYGEIFTWRRPRRPRRPWEPDGGAWLPWIIDVLYWTPVRLLTFRGGLNGLLAVPDSTYVLGSGAIRIGRLPARNLIERLSPLEAWMPRQVAYRHFALAGPTGAGKTTTLGIAVPFYAAYSGQSVVINDVKLENGGGEYFAWFADHWRRKGAAAIQFNPWAPTESLGLEPLFTATREELDLIVAALTKAAKPAKAADGGGNSAFFENAGRQLLTGLVLAARYLPRRYCSLPTVYRVLSMGARAVVELWSHIERTYPSLADVEMACQVLLETPEYQLEALYVASDGTKHPRPDEVTRALALIDRAGVEVQLWLREARAVYWANGQRGARRGPEWDQRARDLAQRYHQRRQAWEITVREMGTLFDQPMEPTLANIAMTALNTMSPFKAPELQRAFSRPEFQIVDVVRTPTLFVIGSPQAKEEVGGKFVGAVCWQLLLNRVYERSRDPSYHAATAIDVVGLMDEMPALGLESLARLLATIRSYRAPMLGIYQSDNQLKHAYGEDYGTVLDNYVGQATLYSSAGETAKRTADRVGEATILKRQRSTSYQGMVSVGSNGGSMSTSAERVPRMTQADVTEMRVNGQSLGETAAISTSKDRPPFIFLQIPWWEDPVIRRGLRATFHAASGRHRLPENRAPFFRHPLFQVENPDKAPTEEWIYARTPAGEKIPDAHAHDPYRDTVDFLAPPAAPVLFEWSDPVFIPADLGLTPVTAETLQATLNQKLQKGQAPVAAPPKSTSPPKRSDGSSVTTTGAPPGKTEEWRLHFATIRALVDSDVGFPQFPTAPMLHYEDRRYGVREIAEGILHAERERILCAPEGPLPGVPSTAVRWPLVWWLAQGFQTALDFASWLFMWLRHPVLGTTDVEDAQSTISETCALLSHLTGGIATPPHLWGPLLDAADDATPALRDSVLAYLEGARDRLGRARSPEELVTRWADLRAEIVELVPESDASLSRADTLLLVLTEFTIDFAAVSRATFMDLQAFGDPTQTPPEEFQLRYAERNLVYPMPHLLVLREEDALRDALHLALRRFPQRSARLAQLNAACGSVHAEDVLRERILGIGAAVSASE